MAEKLRQIECCIFTLTMLPSKVLERRCDLRLAHVRQLCSWLEVYVEGPLSYIKLQASHVQKNGRPCFLRLLEFLSHRCYSRSTSLPDSWRLPCLDERLTLHSWNSIRLQRTKIIGRIKIFLLLRIKILLY